MNRHVSTRKRISTRTLLLWGLAVTLVLAGVVSFYASGHPDGLEFVAEKLGFDSTAAGHAGGDSPVADYGVRGVENSRLSGGLAGLIGVLLVGIVMTGLVALLRRRTPAKRD